jgi:hypothetical protein
MDRFGVNLFGTSLGKYFQSMSEVCYEREPKVCLKSCDREEMASMRWTHVWGAS